MYLYLYVLHTCMHACMHTYIHTYIYIYIHNRHINFYSLIKWDILGSPRSMSMDLKCWWSWNGTAGMHPGAPGMNASGKQPC